MELIEKTKKYWMKLTGDQNLQKISLYLKALKMKYKYETRLNKQEQKHISDNIKWYNIRVIGVLEGGSWRTDTLVITIKISQFNTKYKFIDLRSSTNQSRRNIEKIMSKHIII